MKTTFALRALFTAATFLIATAASAQTTITAWNFNNLSVGTNIDPAASTGTGTASSVGMINSYTGGSAANTTDISDIVVGVDGSNDWRVRGNGNGWNTAAPEYTQGAQFMESTAGYNNIVFTYDWDTTKFGVRDLQAQYTSDGVHWTNVGALQVANSTSSTPFTTGITLNFAALGITSVNNDANFGVRLVSAFDPSYGAGTSYTEATAPTTVISNTGGNWRFDNIAVSGIAVAAVPEPQTYAMLLAGLLMLAFMTRRRQR